MRKAMRDKGYSTFTDPELWQWHAYDYGWRRVYLKDRNERSPIDEDGAWYDPALATAAERVFPE